VKKTIEISTVEPVSLNDLNSDSDEEIFLSHLKKKAKKQASAYDSYDRPNTTKFQQFDSNYTNSPNRTGGRGGFTGASKARQLENY